MDGEHDDLFESLRVPQLTPEFYEAFRRRILVETGLSLSNQEVMQIWCTNLDIIREQPATIDSRNALVDFDKAASRLLSTLCTLISEAEKGTIIGSIAPNPTNRDLHWRKNLAAHFLDEAIAESEEEGERLGYFWEPKEYVEAVISHITLLQQRARSYLLSAKKVEHGRGRQAAGYNVFVSACQCVWKQHRQDKGYSTRLGRGGGPFVRFVYVAQALLPNGQRKGSEAAVGDAVLKALEETARKKLSVP